MLFGILIHMLHALQHGTINLLRVNLNNIVIMNLNLEHVILFIAVRWSFTVICLFGATNTKFLVAGACSQPYSFNATPVGNVSAVGRKKD